MISFDVKTGQEPLKVSVVQVREGSNKVERDLGHLEIFLSELREPQNAQTEFHIDQQKQDRIYNLPQNAGQIRLGLHWVYSRVKFLADCANAAAIQLEKERNSL